MSYVEFYKLQNDGTQKVLAKCFLGQENIVICEGEDIFVKNLETNGIKDYNSQTEDKLFFKDGIKFLEQLKFNFTSGYLNASDVKEES
ncbi:MAG: hypothetical protein AAB795_00885 [Patescibacteria group bacterium]